MKHHTLKALLLMMLLLLPALLTAQDASPAPAALPRGFDGVMLGDSLETVKEKLKGLALFRYRGDPDVSFLPVQTQSLIDVEGLGHLERGQFQFSDGRLVVITLVINRQRMDYFSMLQTFTRRFGPPADFNPERAVWENAEMRLSLEKPLSVKYLQKTAAAAAQPSPLPMGRDAFLELFK